MTKRRVDYLSYLLRMWRVNGDENESESYRPVWRASLEDPQTGQQQGFGSLEDLFDYLLKKTGRSVYRALPQPESEPPEKGSGE